VTIATRRDVHADTSKSSRATIGKVNLLGHGSTLQQQRDVRREASAMRVSILIILLAATSACSVKSERVEQTRPATTTQQTTTVAAPAGPAVTTTTTTPAR